jgi:hypothetical protein
MMQFFSDSELEDLCFDYFPDVAERFTGGMDKGQKVRLIIGYLTRRGRLNELQSALERERPEQYRQTFGAGHASQVSQRRAAVTPAQIVRNPRQIFLSHASQDAEFARRLAADLEADGWPVWIAPDSIRAGEKWVEAISRGLEESGFFVLIITPAAVASNWVNTETNLAIELQHEGVLHLIPLMLEVAQVPLVWRAYQRVPFRGGYEAGFEQLLARLDESPGTPRPLAGRTHQGTQPIATPRPPTSRPASRTTSPNDLLARLASREPGTRVEAALALGRLGQVDELITTALLRLYNEDHEAAPRHAALEALLALGRAADVGTVFIPASEFLMGSTNQEREAGGSLKNHSTASTCRPIT